MFVLSREGKSNKSVFSAISRISAFLEGLFSFEFNMKGIIAKKRSQVKKKVKKKVEKKLDIWAGVV